MTESRIFKILIKNNKNVEHNFDYPKLQKEASDLIAEKFTDIIYDTLKQKSCASHTKRRTILKYIQSSCRVKHPHLYEDSYECFLSKAREFLQSGTDNSSQLIQQIGCELENEVPNNLEDRVVEFYRRKNSKQKERCKKLEFIGKMNQEKLDLKFNMQARKNFSYYEMGESRIRDLISDLGAKTLKNKTTSTVEYREKQIKFGYALFNLKNSDLHLVDEILQKLVYYKHLEKFEINFLRYLWLLEDDTLNFAPIVSEKFPLILEREILKYATDILRLENDIDMSEYFTKIENDKTIAKIKSACVEDILINKSIKNLIYNLYCYSHCNENILKLIDIVIS